MNIKMLPAELFIQKKTDQTPQAEQPTGSESIVSPPPAAQPQNDVFSQVNSPVPAAPPQTQHVPSHPRPTSNPAAAQSQPARSKIHEAVVSKAAAKSSIAPKNTASMPAPNARYYLCTVTDYSYLIRVVAQYRSLERTKSDFHMYICCTDDDSLKVLSALKLPRCTPVSLAQLGDRELFTLQRERKANEFCWTLKSYVMMYLLQACGLPHVLYCDGDIGFFSNLAPLYEDWGSSAIYLCTQRDVDWVERKYGKYQAGIIGVNNSETGLDMLYWWKNKCREWCFAYEESGQLGDQKYLDDVPALFKDVTISWNRGINAAPWNLIYNNNYSIAETGNGVTIDGDPLVAYHFACLGIYDEQHFDLWSLGSITVQPIVRKTVYLPYLSLLREAIAALKIMVPSINTMFKSKNFEEAKTPFLYSERSLELINWNGEYAFCTLSSQTYVARTLALYSSIRRHLSSFHLWICCADDAAYTILSHFAPENTTLLRVSDVETPQILATRNSKTVAEYCWTLKPALCTYVFQHYNVSRLLYCDSDIYFFSHPRPIHELWNNYTTLLNRQLGTTALENKHGMYQAGMIGFSKSVESLDVLRWWLNRCTEWCYDDHSDHRRWGDQKYLQSIPDLFRSIRVNDRYALVAAPWNIVMSNTKGLQVSRVGHDVYVGSEKLVSYHFGSINMLSPTTFDLWKHEPLKFDKRILDYIYTPYLKKLSAISEAISSKGLDTAMLYEGAKNVYNPFSISASEESKNDKLLFDFR